MTRHRYYKPSWKRVAGDPTMSGDFARLVGWLLAASLALMPPYLCLRAMFGVYGFAWGVVGWIVAALFFAAVCGFIVMVGEAPDPAEVEDQDAEPVEDVEPVEEAFDPYDRDAVAKMMARRRPPV